MLADGLIIGAKVVRYGRDVTCQLAESAVPRTLFAEPRAVTMADLRPKLCKTATRAWLFDEKREICGNGAECGGRRRTTPPARLRLHAQPGGN